jgi:pimeloyl-ACP methyl ester carboxylesterase
MKVPLDYQNPDAGSAVIPLIRIPANVSANDPSYRGPILFNPGGPGGSGTSLIISTGNYFASMLGPQYDILGFDPRGVAFATPGVTFSGSQIEEALWNESPGQVDLNFTEPALGTAYAKAQVSNKLAEQRAADVLPYINTDYTARDMMTIVEAHGRDKIMYWGIS